MLGSRLGVGTWQAHCGCAFAFTEKPGGGFFLYWRGKRDALASEWTPTQALK
jgi:hypothetical protein